NPTEPRKGSVMPAATAITSVNASLSACGTRWSEASLRKSALLGTSPCEKAAVDVAGVPGSASGPSLGLAAVSSLPFAIFAPCAGRAGNRGGLAGYGPRCHPVVRAWCQAAGFARAADPARPPPEGPKNEPNSGPRG